MGERPAACIEEVEKTARRLRVDKVRQQKSQALSRNEWMVLVGMLPTRSTVSALGSFSGRRLALIFAARVDASNS